MSLEPSKTKSDSKIGQRKAIEKRNMKREICFPIWVDFEIKFAPHPPPPLEKYPARASKVV